MRQSDLAEEGRKDRAKRSTKYACCANAAQCKLRLKTCERIQITVNERIVASTLKTSAS